MTCLVALILAALTLSAGSPVGQLRAVSNERLAYILANVQILVETNAKESKALRVRLLIIPEHGECGGTPESCPKVELFVAVSGFDELPDQRVYQLPKQHDWRFISWDRLPDADDVTDYAEFTIEADFPVAQPAAGWWRAVRYHLRVNYRDGTITEKGAG